MTAPNLTAAPEREGAVEENTEGLLQATFEAAQYLLEGDWYSAVRLAYRAAWYFHRLPESAQRAYVETELLEDRGPMPDYGDWSLSAFVAWFVWRANRLATSYGRPLSAIVADPERTQKEMFG